MDVRRGEASLERLAEGAEAGAGPPRPPALPSLRHESPPLVAELSPLFLWAEGPACDWRAGLCSDPSELPRGEEEGG